MLTNKTHQHQQHKDIASINLHSYHTALKQTLPIPDTDNLSSTIVAASRRWILTVALINFDLDQGPDFDNCYPPLQLTSHQMSNIAFSSFPDCAKGGSLIFSWRIPGNSSSIHQNTRNSNAQYNHLHSSSPSLSQQQEQIGLNLYQSNSSNLHSNLLASPSHSPNSDLCGYVYFVQEKDPTVFRGYNQRSVVLITHLSDYVGLFSTLVSRLGPLYASQGPKILETAIQNIASWPDPIPGTNPELMFLGQQHKFIIPLNNQAQILEPQRKTITKKMTFNGREEEINDSSRNEPTIEYSILASNPTTYLSYILFGSHNISNYSSTTLSSSSSLSVSSLWLIWELLILAEPLVVFGSTPDIVSDTILHLKNLIRPIPFHSNWRPYITIHDPDFPILFSKNATRAVGLIGVTNPIILTNVNSWSNILILTNQQGGWSNHHIGLMTDRKRVSHKNKLVAKQIQFCLDHKDYHQADVIISRHFSLLTEQFLQPLQRYFTTLVPSERRETTTEPERTRSFNTELFLKSLKEHTTALEFRSRLKAGLNGSMISVPGFYTSFLRCSNFSAWLHCQVDLADLTVRNRYLLRVQSIPLDSHHHWSSASPSNSTATTSGTAIPHINRLVKGFHDRKELCGRSYSTAPNDNNGNSSSNNDKPGNSLLRSSSTGASRISNDRQSRLMRASKKLSMSWTQQSTHQLAHHSIDSHDR